MGGNLIRIYRQTQTGQLGDSLRQVTIAGTATISNFRTADSAEQELRARMENEGWLISNVDIQGGRSTYLDPTLITTAVLGIRYKVSIRIVANVLDRYSNRDVLNGVLASLENYKLTVGVTTWRVLDDPLLEVTGADNTQSNAPVNNSSDIWSAISGGKKPTTAKPTTNQNQTQIVSNAPNSNSNGFLDSVYDSLNPTKLFGTAGVTVGVVALVAIGILIVKR